MSGSSSSSSPAGDMSSLLSTAYTTLVQNLSSSVHDVMSIGTGGGQQQANQGADLKALASQEIGIANEKAAIQLQQDNQANREALGLTPLAIAAKARELASDEQDIQQRYQMIQGKEDAGFFDDPIGFISNQITLPFDKEALQNKAASVAQKFQDLKNAGEVFDAGARANLAADTGASAARMKGITDLASAVALQEKSEASFKAAQLGIQALNVRIAATGEEFRGAIALNDAAAKAATLDLQAKELDIKSGEYTLEKQKFALAANADARAAESHELEKTIQGLTVDDMQRRNEAYNDIQKRLDTVNTVLGSTKMSVQEFQMMSPQRKALIEQAMSDPDIINGKLGYDPISSLNLVNNLNAPLTPGANIIRQDLLDITQGVEKQYGQLWKTFTPDQQHVYQINAIKDNLKTSLSNIPDTGNIYSPPTLSSVLSMPVLANLPITKYLAPLAVSNKLYPTRPDDLFAQGAMMIAKGEATPAEIAAQISTIYQAIIADNNTNRQYSKFQIQPMSTDIGFNATAKYGPAWGQSRVVNMASPSDVQNFILRSMINNTTDLILGAGAP